MNSLRSLLDQASGFAETLFDPDDVLTPHFVAEDATGGITIAAIAASGPDLDRLRAGFELRLTLERYRRWVFFSEAWRVEFSSRAVPTVEPQDHPERVEVVMFDAGERGSDRRLRATRQIYRHEAAVRLLPLVVSRLPHVDVPSASVPAPTPAAVGR